MILVAAPYPDSSNEKDGMIQRVMAIDSLMENKKRVYMDISRKKHFKINSKNIDENLKVYKLNLFLHFPIIIYLILTAKVIYVHSVFNAMNIFFAYFIRNCVITDMHGVVPEEALYNGHHKQYKVFGLIEKIVIKKSALIIVVTKAMELHFDSKYKTKIIKKYLVLPIISDGMVKKTYAPCERDSDGKTVIYSGGLQKWQNIDLMLSALKLKPEYNYLFLVSNIDALNNAAQKEKVSNYDVFSVPADKVEMFYKKSDYGLLLRESILVNKVACPTKCIEYMANGVIPVVLNYEIGDFYKLGAQFILWDDFIGNNLFSKEINEKMIANNHRVISELVNSYFSNAKILSSYF